MTLSGAAIIFALQGGSPASAQQNVDCTRTPNHPSCRTTTTRDCARTPNHPDCRECPPVTDPYATTTTRPGQCPPNQSTTTTTQRGCRPLVEVNITNGPPGVQVVVTVDLACFPPGTLITITFNGTPIGTVTVGPNGQAALGGSGLAALNPAHVLSQLRHLFDADAAQGSTAAGINFNVPEVTPGTYPVCAIVDGFEPGCTNFTVTGVGGVSQGRGSGGSGSGTLTGAFGRTGLALVPWLAVGALAIAAGVVLKRSNRRTRRVTS